MRQYLFAYGTLLPDRAPREIVGAARRLREVGAGTVNGRLYDLGRFPGAVLDPSARTKVHGRIFQLPRDPDVLAAMDSYEGFDPEDPRTSLFVRTTAPTTMSDGRTLTCWVYVYNGDTRRGRLLPSGRGAKGS